MKAFVVGIRRGIDFTSDDGKHISGSKLHIEYVDENVDGKAVMALFVPSDVKTSHVVPNKEYDFIYQNGFGRRPRLVEVRSV